MLRVSVALPSGRSETFSLPKSSKVEDLRVLAQKSFQLGFLRLVTANHRLVQSGEPLQAAEIEDGDQLTAIAVEGKIAATKYCVSQKGAFASFCRGGDRVVTWGTEYGRNFGIS